MGHNTLLVDACMNEGLRRIPTRLSSYFALLRDNGGMGSDSDGNGMLPTSVRVSAHYFAGVLRPTASFQLKNSTPMFSVTLIGSFTRGWGYLGSNGDDIIFATRSQIPHKKGHQVPPSPWESPVPILTDLIVLDLEQKYHSCLSLLLPLAKRQYPSEQTP